LPCFARKNSISTKLSYYPNLWLHEHSPSCGAATTENTAERRQGFVVSSSSNAIRPNIPPMVPYVLQIGETKCRVSKMGAGFFGVMTIVLIRATKIVEGMQYVELDSI
jgi:hypothetical protein